MSKLCLPEVQIHTPLGILRIEKLELGLTPSRLTVLLSVRRWHLSSRPLRARAQCRCPRDRLNRLARRPLLSTCIVLLTSKLHRSR